MNSFECNNIKIIDTHCRSIKNILLIEDSVLAQNTIKDTILNTLSLTCDVADTEAKAKELLQKNSYDLLIVDIYLPDSSNNFIGSLIRKEHPLIVITGSENEDQRQKIVSLPIVDYLCKADNTATASYLTKTIKRLNQNKGLTIGICDDSKLSRLQIKKLLSTQNIAYIEFENGQEAYNCIIKNKTKIDLLLTDVNMPVMGGLELIRKLRLELGSYELPILAFSSSEEISLVSQLLKSGANDYITKPINNEEFLTRLNISIDNSRLFKENQNMITALRKTSITDFLTSLYNRHYFYESIIHIQARSKRENNFYGIIMIDIDFFKQINDKYGHEFGDIVLIEVAKIIKDTGRDTDIPCRWGGEEFLILVPNTSLAELSRFAQRLRKTVEHTNISSEDNVLNVDITISCGVAISDPSNIDNVDDVISLADERLYKAKETGRNRVIYE